MSKIFVLDKSLRFAHLLAAGLQKAGFQTGTAVDSAESMMMMNMQRPDLLVLDIAVAGMEDLKFLRALRGDPRLGAMPVILLATRAEKHTVVQAGALGVRDYILKSRIPLDDIVGRIVRLLGQAPDRNTNGSVSGVITASAISPSYRTLPAAQMPHRLIHAAPSIANACDLPALLEKDVCIRRAQKSMEGRTLSGAVAQVMALAGSSKSDIPQLAALIARDAVLSARVLHAANSPAYASKRGVIATLPEAVRNIGCSTVRNIAATVGVFDAMPPTGADGFNPIRCWQHSFAVARLSEILMSSIDEEQASIAYLAGLCHDLAQILFHTQFGPEHKQIIEAEAKTGLPREQIERQMLGITHAELVRTINTCIGLPETIRRPVEALYARGKQIPEDPVGKALFVADAFANGMTMAASPSSAVSPLLKSLCQKAAGATDPPVPEPEEFCAEIFGLTALLSRMRPEEEAEFLKPVFPRSKQRIFLASEPAFSRFDPIAAAVRAMCDVEAIDRLPQPDELSKVDGMVVVTRNAATPKFAPADILRCLSTRPSSPLPVLWITTDRSDQSGNDPIQRVTAPIALANLAEFVHSTPVTHAIAA